VRRSISAVSEGISGMYSPFEWACLGIIGLLHGPMVRGTLLAAIGD
jgi:hypothetical protein